jgi:hypothetical protein
MCGSGQLHFCRMRIRPKRYRTAVLFTSLNVQICFVQTMRNFKIYNLFVLPVLFNKGKTKKISVNKLKISLTSCIRGGSESKKM